MSKSLSLTDTHCHLTAESFDEDRNAVLSRARKAGVASINVVGYTLGHSQKAVEMCKGQPHLHAAVGISPHDAKDAPHDFRKKLERLVLDNRHEVVAIGETGLDFYHLISPRELQIDCFTQHVELARELGLPLVIHVREAFEETIEILQRLDADQSGGVFHCFTGSPEQAKQAAEMGFYVSFAGIITFKKAELVRESATAVPDDRLLVETDAPYLAPVPKRGKRNEPAFLVYTVREMARIRKTSPEHIAEMTTLNALRLFGTDSS